ncbi:helicase [Dyadobacter flavalbus]|uniref:Helicase n=1 Tax=Dyadobacter flavalbus TaxID=2579942 RepID=A0A5M8R3Z1_9BACT|nr:primase-helicase family protein [Dyadobacter flavalbus]KAA6440872.1 helicase [Dyadobacter flavalbus]
MKNKHKYLRIGTSYFKEVRKPLSSGDTMTILVPWSADCIRLDHDRKFLKNEVERYDGFCFVPSHLNYEQKVVGFYNRYQPFQHVAKKGDSNTIFGFLRHIFGEQIEMGYDYFKVLLEKPTQILPILCLVSEERNTGKTTFLHFVKSIFGENMTINSNEDFRSNFNIEWAQKLIIGVDETFLDRKEDSERIKNLSTAKFYKIEAKGFDRQEIEFFGKFILCSNNEDHFIIAEPGEIRYWVRKIPVLKFDNEKLLAELQSEIPYFIHFLIHRDFTYQQQTRMWFTAAQIATPALKKLLNQNRNKLELEIAHVLLTIVDEKDLDEIKFCTADVQDWLNKKHVRYKDLIQIKRILQNNWKLVPAKNSLSYLQYKFLTDGSVFEQTGKGRYYILSKKQINEYNDII